MRAIFEIWNTIGRLTDFDVQFVECGSHVGRTGGGHGEDVRLPHQLRPRLSTSLFVVLLLERTIGRLLVVGTVAVDHLHSDNGRQRQPLTWHSLGGWNKAAASEWCVVGRQAGYDTLHTPSCNIFLGRLMILWFTATWKQQPQVSRLRLFMVWKDSTSAGRKLRSADVWVSVRIIFM